MLIKSSPFGKPLKTHLEQASSDKNDDNSRFYHSFPSKPSARGNSCTKEGYFKYLTAYIVVGFSVEHRPGCFLKSGGLLMYTKGEEKWISGLNFRGKTDEQKFMQMSAYLFELVH